MAADHDKKLTGFLTKIEQRTIGGASKRKYWFVLDPNSPFLYWYKAETDINCCGRVSLSGAAFTYDPRDVGRFEIYSSSEVHILECEDNKIRTQWLQQLQANRRRHYQRENVDDILNVEVMSTTSHSNIARLSEFSSLHAVDACTLPDSSCTTSSTVSPTPAVPGPSGESSNGFSVRSRFFEEFNQMYILQSDTRFYLSPDGELIPTSLDMSPPPTPNRDLIKIADGILSRIADETQSTAAKLENKIKTRKSIRLPSFSLSNKSQCENCKELLKLAEELKDRCFELTDEVSANQDLVCALKNGMISAHNQRDAVKMLAHGSEAERLQFAIERESLLTTIQLNNAELKRELQAAKDEQRKLEAENQTMQAAMEAFRQSVQTKDELIIKMCESQESMAQKHQQERRERASSGPDAIDIGSMIFRRHKALTKGSGVPEGIPVDGATPTEDATKALLNEANVDDVDELRDLVLGYESQNKFLNSEMLQLQQIVESLEERERKITLQNFKIEASFYKLKSRYMMVLNHFREGFDEAKKKLKPEFIEELIEDVQRPHSFRADCITPKKASLSVVLNTVPEGSMTDSLGFLLHSPRPSMSDSSGEGESSPETESPTAEAIMDKAAELQNLSDQIIRTIQIEQSKQYLDWLQKWDCFLVNHTSNQKLASSNELKALVREGIPHAYRARVWKSLVQIVVSNVQADTGKGYYQCLLKKADATNSTEDMMLRQIDLDLMRTLPNNVHFNQPNTEKMAQLKRVLYAFRFHNKNIEYCQGLNRIAAVGLLYLKEDDAFWFLVAVVEHLQPPDYYTPTLRGAVVDQKVFIDLVQEKVHKLWAHLRSLEVDLSLFTLSWFLTIFVDALSHELYLPIFDAFLLEGNKVVFRFAIAILRACESNLLACTTIGAVHSCLSNLTSLHIDPKDLSKAAFQNLLAFSMKSIESKRQTYIAQLADSRR